MARWRSSFCGRIETSRFCFPWICGNGFLMMLSCVSRDELSLGKLLNRGFQRDAWHLVGQPYFVTWAKRE
jgi:hypothetical protein